MVSDFKDGSPTVLKIQGAEAFIAKNSHQYRFLEVEERRAFPVDLRVLAADEEFISSWPKFQQELEESPEITLGCLGLAMHQVII
jgi:DNA helicase MCM8